MDFLRTATSQLCRKRDPRRSPVALRQPRLPSLRNSALMQNTEDLNRSCFSQEIHAVRESPQQHSPGALVLNRVSLRVQGCSLNRCIQFEQEFSAKAGTLEFVPLRGLTRICCRLGSNADKIQSERSRANNSSRTSAQGLPGSGFTRNARKRSSRIALWWSGIGTTAPDSRI